MNLRGIRGLTQNVFANEEEEKTKILSFCKRAYPAGSGSRRTGVFVNLRKTRKSYGVKKLAGAGQPKTIKVTLRSKESAGNFLQH